MRGRMSRGRLVCATLAALLLSGPFPAFAHHGVAAYDISTKTTLEGTVTSFEWENPHALIYFDVTDDTGKVQEWTAETAGLVILVRAGWNKNSLKPGERCKMIGHRAKNGSNTMILQSVVLSNGKELSNLVP